MAKKVNIIIPCDENVVSKEDLEVFINQALLPYKGQYKLDGKPSFEALSIHASMDKDTPQAFVNQIKAALETIECGGLHNTQVVTDPQHWTDITAVAMDPIPPHTDIIPTGNSIIGRIELISSIINVSPAPGGALMYWGDDGSLSLISHAPNSGGAVASLFILVTTLPLEAPWVIAAGTTMTFTDAVLGDQVFTWGHDFTVPAGIGGQGYFSTFWMAADGKLYQGFEQQDGIVTLPQRYLADSIAAGAS